MAILDRAMHVDLSIFTGACAAVSTGNGSICSLSVLSGVIELSAMMFLFIYIQGQKGCLAGSSQAIELLATTQSLLPPTVRNRYEVSLFSFSTEVAHFAHTDHPIELRYLHCGSYSGFRGMNSTCSLHAY